MSKFKQFIGKNKSKIILLIILVVFAACFYEYFIKYYHILKSPEAIRDIILGYGNYSFIAYILLQVAQIIIFFIPGELVQIAGGYIFGSFLGFILSFIGILIGSVFSFMVARLLGKKFVEKIVFKDDKWIFRKIEDIKRDHTKFKKLVFIMYVIPGIPKDILGYICGVTNLTLREFIFISMVGRIPALFLSNFFGDKISKENIVLLICIAVISVIVFLLSIIKGKKFISNYGEK
ncbi:TVP38/TMEM64 family protein [Clostridium sp.]|uniref:TVP38/TMEM64 family protein n=1 Tax=Clostridium sp. TaxID=1506 RepID=UPI003F341C6B